MLQEELKDLVNMKGQIFKSEPWRFWTGREEYKGNIFFNIMVRASVASYMYCWDEPLKHGEKMMSLHGWGRDARNALSESSGSQGLRRWMGMLYQIFCKLEFSVWCNNHVLFEIQEDTLLIKIIQNSLLEVKLKLH